MTEVDRTEDCRGRSGAAAALWLFAALALGGCAAAADDTETVASDVKPLWLWSGATQWAGGVVPVCWDPNNTPEDLANYAGAIQREASNSWPTFARVYFIGWNTCPTDTRGVVSVRIDRSFPNSSSGGTGYTSAGLKMRFGRDATSNHKTGTVPHEFGHVLGFAHEMARADFPDDTNGCSEADFTGNALNTRADRGSIMAFSYCASSSGDLTLWDVVGVQTAYGARLTAAAPLITGFQGSLGDHASVATSDGIASVAGAGYSWVYAEGWVFRDQLPGTIPLKLYWHPGRGDNLTTASPALRDAALAAGYTLVRTEGYVFATSQPGTVPLDQYWSSARADHMLVSTDEARQNAVGAGYERVGTEGYIPRSTPYALAWAYWHAGRGDNLITAQNSGLSADAATAGYQFVGFDGAFWRFQYPGTVPLKTYWQGTRADHFALATGAGESSAIGAGYTYLGSEGFVYSTPQTGMSPYGCYWHSGRGDNLTTMINGAPALSTGYEFVRQEGWGIPLVP